MSEEKTIIRLYREGVFYLRERGFSEAESDVWLLTEHVFGIKRSDLYAHPEAVPREKEERLFWELIHKRGEHVPVQYLTGEAYFYGEAFWVTRDCLIPRMDTETLVEAALDFAGENREKGEALDILDLCTGSGCILLSLLRNLPGARGVGTDLSPGALAVARRNAQRFGLSPEFLEGDLFCMEALSGRRFDLIVSNPPYIERGEIPYLMEEVRLYEPSLALDGGEDGLDFYRRILRDAKGYLKEDGALIMEIGALQGEALLSLCQEAGYASPRVIKDLSKLDRVVFAALEGTKHQEVRNV